MKIAPFFAKVLVELDKAMQGTLNGTKIEGIAETISHFALASAVASMAAAVIPGAGGAMAAIAQAGFVWATYVKINKTVGLSMTTETAKFLANAIATNIITQYGALMAGHFVAGVLSFIPLFGSAGAALAEGAIGYGLIYAAAYVYLKLISRVIKPDGSIQVAEDDSTKKIIEEIMNREDMGGLFREGAKQFKEARTSGALDRAMKAHNCPDCGSPFNPGDHFCSVCGKDLTK
ncbi:MAG: zinc ribbon domain-containing protein [Bacteroidales bacterium]|nr:zinc ribbon domain-containing protein [Bacteroidales bacterium]